MKFRILTVLAMAAVACGSPTSKVTRPTPPAAKEKQPGPIATPEPPPVALEAPRLRLPAGVAPTGYEVQLALDPTQPTFTGVVDIDIAMYKPTDALWLNARNIAVQNATLQVAEQWHELRPVVPENSGFVGFALPPALGGDRARPQTARLHLEYRGTFGNLRSGGIFRMEIDGLWYAFSHFQPLDARKAFPCFDEPQHKVPWRLSITTNVGNRAFANTPQTQVRTDGDSQAVRHDFAESKPLPSYLLSIAVGPFDVVDLGEIGRNKTPARIVVPKGRASQAKHASTTIPRILDWLEDYFDMPYPYKKLDSVTIPNQGGAMEHPGLISYASEILLVKDGERTDRFDSFHAMVVAHELAHQWFGNLVTLAWWNDLWLNESFATWMASKVRHSLNPAWDSEVHEYGLLEATKRSDSDGRARSLRRAIASDADIEGAFDAISYGKGGAVLTMFERWVGPEAFRRGVRAYIRKHAWGTTTSDDFLDSLGEVADPAITKAFKTFLTQPGLPVVAVDLLCARGRKPTVSLTQGRHPASTAAQDGRWSIPVCVRYGRGKRAHRQCHLLTEKTASVTLAQGRGCPQWLVANAHGAGYYRVAYSDSLRKGLLDKHLRLLDPLEQISTINDALALAQAGELDISELLRAVPKMSRHKQDRVVAAAAKLASSVRLPFVRDDLRDTYQRFVQQSFGKRARSLGWLEKPGEKSATRKLRLALVPLVAGAGRDAELRAQAKKLADLWLDKAIKIDRELAGALLSAALADADDATYRQFAAAALKEDDFRRKFAILIPLAQTDRLDRLQDHWKKVLNGSYNWFHSWAFLRFPLQGRKTSAAAYEFIMANYDQIARNMPTRWRARLLAVFEPLCDDGHYRDLQRVGPEKVKSVPGGQQVLDKTLTTIKQCVTLRARQQPQLESFLRGR